jgi:hypothetical protein
MSEEGILVLNDIEKHIACDLIQKFVSGELPYKAWHPAIGGIYEISYEYHSDKHDKFISGIMLGCPYRLRYRDSRRIFFSAWRAKDVCSIFYDMVVMTHILANKETNIEEYYLPFKVDLNTNTYVFITGDIAVWLMHFGSVIRKEPVKVSHKSQYTLSVFDESETGVYGGLIERLKAENYDDVYVLQIWIRGEVLYFAIADGAITRSLNQRIFTEKEEKDLIRKSYKSMNEKYRLIDFSKPVHD